MPLTEADGPAGPRSRATQLDHLPDEILIQIFGALSRVGGLWEEDDPHGLLRLPYRAADTDMLPCTGLRGYPFLAQVCRKWRDLLAARMAQALVWRRVCLDFGHELVTSVHTPLRWSSTRPSAAEFQEAFAATRLSAGKILTWLGGVAPHVSCLALSCAEGYEGEEGEYVCLGDRHDFGPAALGWALALVRATLTELRLYRCHDLAAGEGGVWALAAQLPALRSLAVEGLRAPVAAGQLAVLGQLRQLESLSLTGEAFRGDWAVGLDGPLPDAWSRLTSLTRLELRAQPQLPGLPGWLAGPGMARLRALDVSGCGGCGLELLPRLTQLHVLVLQSLDLSTSPPSPAELAAAAAAGAPLHRHRPLPDLSPLAPQLRSLSLAANRLGRLPDWLPRMARLEHLDCSYNKDLQLAAPLAWMGALPHLALADFRQVHVVADKDYWPADKCTTMDHLTRLARALRRRAPPPRLLFDV